MIDWMWILLRIQLILNHDTCCLYLRTTRRPMKCYSKAAHGQLRYVDCHSKSLYRVEFQRPILFWSIVSLANGLSIPLDLWSLNGIRQLFKWQESFETASRSTGFALIFDRMTMFRRFSSILIYLSIVCDIQPWLTNHWLESIDAFAVNSSGTKQSTARTNRNTTNADKTMNTIGIVAMLSNPPIATQQEKRETNQ